MIAIDTNVLLRYLLDDDKQQSKRAAKLIDESETVLITDIVLVETLWTLKGKKYKLGKDGLIKVLNSLFEEPNLCFEDDQTVWRALSDFRKAKPTRRKALDFPDALIINKAKYHAESTNQSMDGVYSFDMAAQQLPGAKKL
ncbi:MAG: type II toxin-antitoxin system VapC family toxin [Candidatus Thiodiazotropha weberae]|uniref:Twitching motility protein PilT n=1 Tax=Candidatus Thiodiazotropha endoloripes TaxID=1818881 RepID=A0A1E2UUM4_9GAMM|nr:type II toxin-antitoxin system VapC family toxin [Candidatus Thiodiazotropha endoloripes]MCG7897872.1 type II toxin-antitoxin system VapC family toxin [Candidatus Thiodiazotropha weberae]MCG7904748.1 type II toxin-antitoxin system VapC family toxin [Candidatus Thiodiazotropha weberae]ODB86968.1 twitching motility protein PilT [Candidatus Thiodiazotropha endoloripes]ODB98134.1 twitching motility protein PilT [Candidatus Thiodiazotropha endoloripes]